MMSRPEIAFAAGVAAATAAYLLYKKSFASAGPPSKLSPQIYDSKAALGEAAANYVAQKIGAAIAAQGHARVIVATGASQFEFLEALVKLPIQWDKVTFFHLDEYFLPETHGASFRKYLRDRLFSKLKPQPAKVNYVDPAAPDKYASLLAADAIDLACIGIGENGHIAFNDPPVADFNDPLLVKKVALDDACRQQQFGEGWFPTLADVPTHAITLTVPAIMRAKAISCVVPDERKAVAVRGCMRDPIGTACPATILRSHPECVLFLDRPSASLL